MVLEFWIPQHSFFSELDTKLSLTSPIQSDRGFFIQKNFYSPILYRTKGICKIIPGWYVPH